MTIQVEEIVKACEVIARQDNLDVCFTESLKGSVITGLSAFICAVTMGPIGLAIGGAVGGAAGAYMSKSYKPLWQIMDDMTQADKILLSNHMLSVLQRLEITDAILLMSIASSPTSAARETIVKELLSYASTLAITATASSS